MCLWRIYLLYDSTFKNQRKRDEILLASYFKGLFGGVSPELIFFYNSYFKALILTALKYYLTITS